MKGVILPELRGTRANFVIHEKDRAKGLRLARVVDVNNLVTSRTAYPINQLRYFLTNGKPAVELHRSYRSPDGSDMMWFYLSDIRRLMRGDANNLTRFAGDWGLEPQKLVTMILVNAPRYHRDKLKKKH